MTPVELSSTVLRAVRRAVDAGELAVVVPERVQVGPPGAGGLGDYATNVALRLARPAGRPPREVAEILRPHLSGVAEVARVEITGPGFLNITVRGRGQALVAEVLRAGGVGGAEGQGEPYGYVAGGDDVGTGSSVRLRYPREVRAAVSAQVLARILRSQGTLVRTSCEVAPGHGSGPGPDPAWAKPLGVTLDPDGAPGTPSAPAPLDINLRPVPAGQDPTPLGRDAARWALLHPTPHDRPHITDEHLVQRESNPLFRVRYAHARSRALVRNAAGLGFGGVPGEIDSSSAAGRLLDALDGYPHALSAAARHRGPDRLARHLVVTADAMLAFQHTVLPLGDEKPSAAHRHRLALAEAAGTVLAGGLSLLGIDAPAHL
ncbi:ArgS-related anticodon-binding protein NrtL [Streptomyces sp. CWNU-52B]|uniref:ArgS-related anticodon-binding protein NrtL n=1 Tax=unclassified Streptomyces TaxID=2593676 RepID=UPI0039BF9BE3